MKVFSPSPQATEVLTRQKVVFSLENKKEMSFDRCGKEEAQADYEREEYKNDVRYQDRTEITLDYEWQNVIKGYFHVWEDLTHFTDSRGYPCRAFPPARSDAWRYPWSFRLPLCTD